MVVIILHVYPGIHRSIPIAVTVLNCLAIIFQGTGVLLYKAVFLSGASILLVTSICVTDKYKSCTAYPISAECDCKSCKPTRTIACN